MMRGAHARGGGFPAATVGRRAWTPAVQAAVVDIAARSGQAGPGASKIERLAAARRAMAPAKPRVPAWCLGIAAPLPPSDGAHRLRWFMARQGLSPAAIGRLAGVGGCLILRVLEGEVSPSDALAEQLARISEGAVRPEAWARPALRGWLDAAPAPRCAA